MSPETLESLAVGAAEGIQRAAPAPDRSPPTMSFVPIAVLGLLTLWLLESVVFVFAYRRRRDT